LNSDTLLGILIGGIIGLGGAIGRDIINQWRTRPRISVCEESVEVKFDYLSTLPDQPTKFIGTRIRVYNKGSTAAEDCKASLIVGEQENRVAWLIPKQDFTIIINPYDSEYVDLCAISSSPHPTLQRHTIIFTTERGYGTYQEHGRPVNISGILEADLKISSRNAKRSVKKIWIYGVPGKDGKIVYFKAPPTVNHNNKKIKLML
jgi:hypothetical protein